MSVAATDPAQASRRRAMRFVGVALAVVAVIVGVTWYADRKPEAPKTQVGPLAPLKDGDPVTVFDPDYDNKKAAERKAAEKAEGKPTTRPEALEPPKAPEPEQAPATSAAAPPAPPSAPASTPPDAPEAPATPPKPPKPPAKAPATPPKPPKPPATPPKPPAPPKPPTPPTPPQPPPGDPYD